MLLALFSGLSFILSVISLPIIIKICHKLGLYDKIDARKVHTGKIPRLGGLAIFGPFFVSSGLYYHFNEDIMVRTVLPLLIAGMIVYSFGLIDDLFDLKAIIKLIGQVVATSIVVLNGFCFSQVFGFTLPKVLSVILTFGWVLGLINAYNLIDGLDGLCGMLSITVIITLGVCFLMSGNIESSLCFILSASILGFLIFNFPPAKTFMGDNGAPFLGFMIAILPLYSSSNSFEYNKVLMMIVLAAFPIFDTIAAIWRRLREHRSIMSPDKSHLHHKLMNMGYSGKQVLFIMTLLQLLICATVVLSLYLGFRKGTALLLETLAFVTIFFSVIHFANRAVLSKHNSDNSSTEEHK